MTCLGLEARRGLRAVSRALSGMSPPHKSAKVFETQHISLDFGICTLNNTEHRKDRFVAGLSVLHRYSSIAAGSRGGTGRQLLTNCWLWTYACALNSARTSSFTCSGWGLPWRASIARARACAGL